MNCYDEVKSDFEGKDCVGFMQNFRNIFIFILAWLIALTLDGCQTGQTSQATTTPSGDTATAVIENTSTEPESAQPAKVTPAPVHQPKWVKKADLPEARGHSTVEVNDLIYALGTDEEGYLTVDVYHPDKDQWTRKAGKSSVRNTGVFAIAAVNDTIYIMGGFFEGRPVKTVEAYDTVHDYWTPCTALPVEIDCAAAATAYGKVYVIGGADRDDNTLRSVWEYDPVQDSWLQRQDMPTARRELGVVGFSGKIYAIGGYNTERITNCAEVYDPVTDQWTKLAAMPKTWAPTALAEVNGCIYTICSEYLLKYNTRTNEWAVFDRPNGMDWLAAMASAKGNVYTVGGYVGNYPNGEYQKAVWQYDAVDAFDGMTLQKETEHFLLYSCKTEASYVEALSAALESFFEVCCDKLGYPASGRIMVRIYPSLKELHEAIGFPNAPDHLIAAGRIDGIHMASPAHMGAASIISPERVVQHELVHVMTGNRYGPRPAWLTEGVASFMAGDISDVKGQIAHRVRTDTIPSLVDLNTSYESFMASLGYPFSYTVIDYIVSTYGFDKLIALLEQPDDFSGVFGMDRDGFQDKWHAFVLANY